MLWATGKNARASCPAIVLSWKEASSVHGCTRAYEQLGQRALGPAGKVVVAAVICLHNVGAMSSYLFIIKSELPLVIGTFLDMDPER